MNEQKIVYAVLETIYDVGSSQSKEIIAQVLFGSKRKKIKQKQLDKSSNYGAFLSQAITYSETLHLIDKMVEKELLVENRVSNYSFLVPSQLGAKCLVQQLNMDDYGLFETEVDESSTVKELKILRKKLAYELNLSPFIIFNDQVLKQIEEKKPVNKEQFVSISGLADVKWHQFGEQVCQIFQ